MATTKAHNNGHHEKNVSLFVSHLARRGGRRGNRHTLGRGVKYVHVPSAGHHLEYGAYLAVLVSAVCTLCLAGDRVCYILAHVYPRHAQDFYNKL